MRMGLTCAAIVLMAIGFGCKRKGGATVIEAPVIEADRPGFGSAKEQLAKAAEAARPGGALVADPEKPWGVKVSELIRPVMATALNCNDKYFKALKPDELLVGKPALVTTDGVVTVMRDDCDALKDDLEGALILLEGKHPKADELLKTWTLMADIYSRISRSAINIGAKSGRRKLNHGEMVKVLPTLTTQLIPAFVAAAGPFLKMGEDDKPIEPSAAFAKTTPAEARSTWEARMTATTADLAALQTEWMEKCHDLLMGDLYARKRYLGWLGRHWQRRLSIEKRLLARTSTGDADFDEKLREAVGKYYTAVDEFYAGSWTLGMTVLDDKTLIDEEKLKAGKEGFVKGGKRFRKAVKKIKLPKI